MEPRMFEIKKISDKQYHVDLDIVLKQEGKSYKGRALLDTGATGSLIHSDIVKKLGLKTKELAKPRRIYNADGSMITGGIKSSVTTTIDTNISNNRHTFAVSKIGDDQIILGLDWFKKVNPIINWKTNEISNQEKTATTKMKLRSTNR